LVTFGGTAANEIALLWDVVAAESRAAKRKVDDT